MIVVVGGTGRLGRLVTTRLSAEGRPVRVVARSPKADLPEGATFARADVRDPATLPPAFAGVSVVVSAVHGVAPGSGESPAEVDRDGNLALIEAARAAGADIVLLSTIGAAPDHPMELMRMKAVAERALAERTDGAADWTVVRASAFLELYAELLRQTAGRTGVPKVFGRGANPINFVSVTDVAAVTCRAVVDRSLRGQTIDVTGPDDLTMTELARLVTGQDRATHVPRPVLRSLAILLRPIRPAQARLIRMAVQMDTLPMAADRAAASTRQPWVPSTPASAVLAPSAGTR